MRRSSHVVTSSCTTGLKKQKPPHQQHSHLHSYSHSHLRTPALSGLSLSSAASGSPPRKSVAVGTRALSVLSSLFPSSVTINNSSSSSSSWTLLEGALGLFQLPNLHRPQDFAQLANEVKAKCDALKHNVRSCSIRSVSYNRSVAVLFAAWWCVAHYIPNAKLAV